MSSLVRLALSSNFPGGLLSTAQSYPSLTSSGQVAGSGVTTTTGAGLGQALTMSLTSTSSDSEQVRIFIGLCFDFEGKLCNPEFWRCSNLVWKTCRMPILHLISTQNLKILF